MPSLPAAPAVIAILASLVEERMGLHYRPDERELLIDRIADRAVEAGFESLLDYYYFLRYDAGSAAEFERLVDTLVVGETYFFRELAPLRVAIARFVRPVVAAGRRARVWSAACATGEEPLTFAMLLADAGLLDHVDLIASDISQRSLARARSGRFGRRALRDLPPDALVARYLERGPDGAVAIAPELVARVDFRAINLTDAGAAAEVGPCDVILCRNVLIYFSDETTTRIADRLGRALAPGGALFVGVSESLLRLTTTLVCEEADGSFFYRRAT